MEKLSAHQKEADIAIAQLKSCEEFAEEELRIGSQQQILVMKRQMVERMRAVCSQVKEDSLQPLEETKLRFVKSTSTLEACRSLGSVVDYSKLKQLKGAITSHEMATAGRKATLELAVTGASLSPDLLSCQLSPAAYPTVAVRCSMRQVTAGRVEVSYCPFTAGPHQLRVQVGGADISDSPFTVEVMPRQVGQTFTGLSSPRGVAIIKEGHLVVAEWYKHCITIINTTSGKKIRSFGSEGSGQVQFSCPLGVAVTQDNHIVVVDQSNHRIQVVTVELSLIHI